MDIANIHCSIRPYWRVGRSPVKPFLFESLICMVTGASTTAEMRAEEEFLKNEALTAAFEKAIGLLLNFDAEECEMFPDTHLRRIRIVMYKHAANGQRMGYAWVTEYLDLINRFYMFEQDLTHCAQAFQHLERKLLDGTYVSGIS